MRTRTSCAARPELLAFARRIDGLVTLAAWRGSGLGRTSSFDARHTDRVQWERDLERDLALSAAGWLVIRPRWRMLTRRPDAAAARRGATLDRRSGDRSAAR